MTDETVNAVKNFIRKWAPANRQLEFIQDIRAVIEIAIKEATGFMLGGR